ncbi:hypothetical protein [uncultured Fluviicola sp.]
MKQIRQITCREFVETSELETTLVHFFLVEVQTDI